MRCLVLNASFEPLCVVSARRAILLVMDKKVEVIERGDESRIYHSQYINFEIPSVIKLKRFVRVPRHRSIPLNTRTVLSRDRHKCAYCGEKATTMDHVDPKKNFGPHLWENVVAACQSCNNRKGHHSLVEMEENRLAEMKKCKKCHKVPCPRHRQKWTLLIKPSRPIGAKASIVAFGGAIEDVWKPFLGLELVSA
jgi:5-methylcytosine-specific restriction endonuclease McrA